jgi:ferredoxin, 2Fe-2S
MPNVTFIYNNGKEQEAHIDIDVSIMEEARAIGVAGIEGDCGGNLSCATRHVYVDQEWVNKVGVVDEMENDLLDATASERKPTSRLSCQILVSEALDGIRIYIPETQY